MKLVVCLGDRALFFETFVKGKFDLDAIKNELHEMDEDIRIKMREGGDIAFSFVLQHISFCKETNTSTTLLAGI